MDGPIPASVTTGQVALPEEPPRTAPRSRPAGLSTGQRLGLVAFFLAALVAAGVYFFEWNMLRGFIAEKVSNATGRRFEINGDLSVDLSLTPRIVARGIVLGNAGWSTEPNMAEIGALDFTLDARRLFDRRIVIPRVTISDARMVLEKHADGTPNWDLGAQGPSDWGPPEVAGLTIDRGRIDYRDPATKTRVTVDASSVPGTGPDAAEMLKIAATGQVKGMPTRVNGEVGSVLELRTPENPYPVKLQGTVGSTRARIDGVLLDPLRLGGENVSFELAGADLAQLLPIIGVPLPPTPAYKLSGHLNHKGAVWTFRRFSGTVGSSDLAGDFTVDRTKKPQLITASLTSRKLDMNDLGGFVGAKRGERASPRPPSPGRVLPRELFDLDKLRIADFDVTFRGRQVVTEKLPLDNLSTNLKVRQGVVTLQPLDFGIAGGHLASNITMDARGAIIKTRADVTARKVRLDRLLPGFKVSQFNTGIISGRAQLDTTGNSVAQMLSGADGNVGLMMEGGSISELVARLSNLDLARSLAIYLTGDRELPVRCMVTQLEGAKGRFDVKTLVVDTSKTKITGAGHVDFAQEAVDLKLVTKPKDFSLVALRGPIAVSGSFENPAVRPDLRNALGRGVLAAALGLVTGGLGLFVPFVELGGEQDSNCAELVRGVG
jgi:uncharacterized protein involved in outer membrane biogenesis